MRCFNLFPVKGNHIVRIDLKDNSLSKIWIGKEEHRFYNNDFEYYRFIFKKRISSNRILLFDKSDRQYRILTKEGLENTEVRLVDDSEFLKKEYPLRLYISYCFSADKNVGNKGVYYENTSKELEAFVEYISQSE